MSDPELDDDDDSEMLNHWPKTIRCRDCKNFMTWAAQRVQFGRLMKRGMNKETANSHLPRCQKCLTIRLKDGCKECEDYEEEGWEV